MEKYRLDYLDSEGVPQLVTISDSNYSGASREITGYAILTGASVDNTLDCIRGKGLRVYLDASTDLTYEDLYTESERSQKVAYWRDGVLLFQGWLDPEGWYEDYVSDFWQSSFDCVDGLGYLTDLAFVDSEGIPFNGVKSMMEVLVLALKRTGFEKLFFVSVDIYYNLADTSIGTLEQTYVITDRYIEDDGDTIMSCREVILDILEPFGAILTDYNGDWCIVKPNSLVSNSTATGHDYTAEGVRTGSSTKDFKLLIGSQVDGFYPHHDKANQRIEREVSLGAYRINYNYGLKQSLISNDRLCNTLGNFPGWTIFGGPEVNYTNDTCGIGFDPIPPSKNIYLAVESTPVPVVGGQQIDFTVTWSYLAGEDTASILYFLYKLIAVDTNTGAKYYYFPLTDEWRSPFSASILFVEDGNPHPGTFEHYTSAAILPEEITEGFGEVYVEIWTPESDDAEPTEYLTLTKVTLTTEADSSLEKKGENHTFTKKNKPFAKVEDVKEVLTGDNSSNLYVGTIYKADQFTPTTEWFRDSDSILTPSKPLLRLMGEEKMRMQAKVMTIFRGGVYGYFNSLSVVEINGFNGRKFMPIQYTYNTLNNELSFVLKEILNEEAVELEYEFTIDYGNVVKPTIKS